MDITIDISGTRPQSTAPNHKLTEPNPKLTEPNPKLTASALRALDPASGKRKRDEEDSDVQAVAGGRGRQYEEEEEEGSFGCKYVEGEEEAEDEYIPDDFNFNLSFKEAPPSGGVGEGGRSGKRQKLMGGGGMGPPQLTEAGRKKQVR